MLPFIAMSTLSVATNTLSSLQQALSEILYSNKHSKFSVATNILNFLE